MRKILWSGFITAGLLVLPAFSQGAAEKTKDAAKSVGKATADKAEDAGDATVKGAKKAGKASKKAADKTVDGTKKAAEEVGIKPKTPVRLQPKAPRKPA